MYENGALQVPREKSTNTHTTPHIYLPTHSIVSNQQQLHLAHSARIIDCFEFLIAPTQSHFVPFSLLSLSPG